MKFSKSKIAILVLVCLFAGAMSSAAFADTVGITVEKWTTNFGALTSSSGLMTVDETDGSVSTFSGLLLWGSGSATDPFAGALDLTVIFGLDSTDPTNSLLSSNIDVKKHGANDSTQYWLKIYVEKTDFPNPASISPLKASTTYSQTLANSTTGSLKSSANGNNITGVTIPFSTVTNSVSFARSGVYDIKQEYDVNLTATKTAHAELLMSTVTVPEPSWTILSALVGLAPMTYVAKRFRRRRADA